MQEEQPLNPAVLGRIPVSVSQAGWCLCFWLWSGFCCFVETDESLFLTLWFPWETPCHQPPQLWQCHSWGGWLHRGQGQQLLVLAIPLHFGIRKTHRVEFCPLHWAVYQPSQHSREGCLQILSCSRKEITAQWQVLPSCHPQLVWEPLQPLTFFPLHQREKHWSKHLVLLFQQWEKMELSKQSKRTVYYCNHL